MKVLAYIKRDLTSNIDYDEFQYIKKPKSGIKEAIVKLDLINPISLKREKSFKLCDLEYNKKYGIIVLTIRGLNHEVY